ncbi:MAG: hypothetical protein VX776_02015 [Planctomycetota bacterium]|nr:hypothetical protein [Planctomycetota bacterium]
MKTLFPLLSVISLLTTPNMIEQVRAEKPQYEAGTIKIVAATADEPLRKSFSLSAAANYLAQGSKAWTEERQCVSCHTNGTFMQLAPSFGKIFAEQIESQRKFFLSESAYLQKTPIPSLKEGLQPTQLAYIANGLAAYDEAQGKLSAETKEALDLMLTAQSEDGSYNNLDCWPPFESSSYHGATIAAMALAAAPGYLEQINQEQQKTIDTLKRYLQTTKPPHDYGRMLLLWTATKWEGLINDKVKTDTIAMILSHQQGDGGWSMRTFAAPEKWGGGVRQGLISSEIQQEGTPSDGHQTGLAIMILREAGIPTEHQAVQAGIKWIKSNQRQSGRWWTRSLNGDGQQYITYSGTFYPLLALQLCGELDKK